MLSPDEMDLVRRDTAIPGLAVALDPDALLEALRRAAPGADPRAARITRLRYEPRRYCRAAYRIYLGETELDVGVRACRPADLAPWLDHGESNVSGLLATGRIVLEDCAVVLNVFPNDPMLPQLQQLTDPVERQHLLRKLLPDQPDRWQGELRCLHYKPERRYVAELLSANGARAILKCYPKTLYARCKHNAKAFQSDGLLRIARPLACFDSRHLIAYEWLPGRLLTDLYLAPDLDFAAVRATGAALATLHAQRPDGLDRWTHKAEAQALVSVSSTLGFICPRFAHYAGELAERLATQLNGTGVSCPVHGDFSANQVLVHDRKTVAIIDLDSARYGDPADDLGNIIAQAERAGLRGDLSPSRVEQLKDALLDGYATSTQRPLPEQIGLWTAVQLFRRTRFPFRTREPDWPQRTESLLERVEAILDASSSAHGKRQAGSRISR